MQKWEYLFVTADKGDKDMTRPRWVNGQELPSWKKGPTFTEFANQMGEQGWELVAAPYTEASGAYGSTGNRRLIFKRPK